MCAKKLSIPREVISYRQEMKEIAEYVTTAVEDIYYDEQKRVWWVTFKKGAPGLHGNIPQSFNTRYEAIRFIRDAWWV